MNSAKSKNQLLLIFSKLHYYKRPDKQTLINGNDKTEKNMTNFDDFEFQMQSHTHTNTNTNTTDSTCSPIKTKKKHQKSKHKSFTLFLH